MAIIKLHLPQGRRHRIFPVFLPFLGCRRRCIFCSQSVQTGQAQAASCADVRKALAQSEILLDSVKPDKPLELAFYGGTFTAIGEECMEVCLEFAKKLQARGRISGFRCSTRPDAVDRARLARLKEAGCHMVELGVQSFSTRALEKSERGHAAEQCKEACRLVHEAQLELGVQLLPGMPGCDPELFLADVKEALKQGADILRFYPCLVLEGSRLAQLWRQGEFAPWDLKTAIESLAQGWVMATQARIPVIRMGLAPQQELTASILAGPWHEALGSRIQGRALLYIVGQAAGEMPAKPQALFLRLPQGYQGCFWGWKKELEKDWKALGVDKSRVRFSADNDISLEISAEGDL